MFKFHNIFQFHNKLQKSIKKIEFLFCDFTFYFERSKRKEKENLKKKIAVVAADPVMRLGAACVVQIYLSNYNMRASLFNESRRSTEKTLK